ncbi:NAD-dependent epimerase/dehydratase [Litoricolaceae bacterium]|nr:NAD-dependent epimerase/dehydratase [Litorivicinaceae bacterium]
MKVLLTGCTGYLGSHLARAFIEDGHDVVALKRQTSSLHRLADIGGRLNFYDIENLDLAKPFEEHGPIDAVVHTATCYGRAEESVSEVFAANTALPLRLLETATFFNTNTFLNTDTVLDPYMNAYSLSKKQFSEWGKQLAADNQIRFLNIRLEHMYGPGDDSSKFTTWIIEQCLANVSEIKLTPGEQKRDFIYVDDVVSAYQLLLNQRNTLDAGFLSVDLGSGKPVSIKEFTSLVCNLSNSKSKLKFGALPYRKGEIMHSFGDLDLLTRLGWRPCVPLRAGIQHTLHTISDWRQHK